MTEEKPDEEIIGSPLEEIANAEEPTEEEQKQIRNVLIAENAKTIRNEISALLEENGYNCDVAEDGKQALNMFENNDYYVVIADLRLPKIGGSVLVQNIHKSKPETEVILVSGKIDDQKKDRLRDRLRVFAYQTKPLDMDRLVDTVDDAFNKRRSLQDSLRKSYIVPLSDVDDFESKMISIYREVYDSTAESLNSAKEKLRPILKYFHSFGIDKPVHSTLNKLIIFTERGATSLDRILRGGIVKMYPHQFKARIEAQALKFYDTMKLKEFKTRAPQVTFEYSKEEDPFSVNVFRLIEGLTAAEAISKLESGTYENEDRKKLARYASVKLIDYALAGLACYQANPAEIKDRNESVIVDHPESIRKEVKDRYTTIAKTLNSVIKLSRKEKASIGFIDGIMEGLIDSIDNSQVVRYREANLGNYVLDLGKEDLNAEELVKTLEENGFVIDDDFYQVDLERIINQNVDWTWEDLPEKRKDPNFVFYVHVHELEDFFHVVDSPRIELSLEEKEQEYCKFMLRKKKFELAKINEHDKQIKAIEDMINTGKSKSLFSKEEVNYAFVRDYLSRDNEEDIIKDVGAYHLIEFYRNLRWVDIIKNRYIQQTQENFTRYIELERNYLKKDLDFSILEKIYAAKYNTTTNLDSVKDLVVELEEKGKDIFREDVSDRGKERFYNLFLNYLNQVKDEKQLKEDANTFYNRAENALSNLINFCAESLMPDSDPKKETPFKDYKDQPLGLNVLIDKYTIERTNNAQVNIFDNGELVNPNEYPDHFDKLKTIVDNDRDDSDSLVFFKLMQLNYLKHLMDKGNDLRW
ncbi:MAG: response regulator [Candidatus Woesearchaeota archaeon]